MWDKMGEHGLGVAENHGVGPPGCCKTAGCICWSAYLLSNGHIDGAKTTRIIDDQYSRSPRGSSRVIVFESGPACSGWVRSGKMDNVRIAQNTYHSLVCDVCEIMIGAPVCVVGLGTFSQSSGAPDGHHLLD